jgi:hypothetical protein
VIRRPTVYRDASYGRCHRRKVDRAEVTADGQVSLSNGTLQRKRTGTRCQGSVPWKVVRAPARDTATRLARWSQWWTRRK